jgi:predicted O-methyltransferase YrrM
VGSIADADLLRALEEQPEEWGQVRISVPPETGKFLHVLVHITKPKRILEIGMFHGYSTTWMGLAARAVGAKITTLELEAEKVAVAEANFAKAGLSDIITVIQGDGRQSLATLAGPYDLVFLDAAKEDYAAYFDLIYPRLSPGGVIVADNAVSHGEYMAEYFDKARNHPNCVSVLVPVGTGEEVTYKKG